eukprot:4864374-Amphidinium_carterae.3
MDQTTIAQLQQEFMDLDTPTTPKCKIETPDFGAFHLPLPDGQADGSNVVNAPPAYSLCQADQVVLEHMPTEERLSLVKDQEYFLADAIQDKIQTTMLITRCLCNGRRWRKPYVASIEIRSQRGQGEGQPDQHEALCR